MEIGIRNILDLTADQVVTNNNVLADSALTFNLAAGQVVKGKLWLPFSVGATGGIAIQLTCINAPTIYLVTGNISNTVTPATIPAIALVQAPINNALAVAGDHFILVDFYLVANLATAVTLQIAQDSADPLSLTLKRGAILETIID